MRSPPPPPPFSIDRRCLQSCSSCQETQEGHVQLKSLVFPSGHLSHHRSKPACSLHFLHIHPPPPPFSLFFIVLPDQKQLLTVTASTQHRPRGRLHWELPACTTLGRLLQVPVTSFIRHLSTPLPPPYHPLESHLPHPLCSPVPIHTPPSSAMFRAPPLTSGWVLSLAPQARSSSTLD